MRAKRAATQNFRNTLDNLVLLTAQPLANIENDIIIFVHDQSRIKTKRDPN